MSKSGEGRFRTGIAATNSLIFNYFLANDNGCEETFYPESIMLFWREKSQIFHSV
jgi:hypothetical protein